MKDLGEAYRFARSLARPVSTGMLPMHDARCAIAVLAAPLIAASTTHPAMPDVEQTMNNLFRFLERAIREYELMQGMAETRISRAVWPMYEAGRPSSVIVAAAERANGGDLPHHEVMWIIRDINRRIVRRRMRRAG